MYFDTHTFWAHFDIAEKRKWICHMVKTTTTKHKLPTPGLETNRQKFDLCNSLLNFVYSSEHNIFIQDIISWRMSTCKGKLYTFVGFNRTSSVIWMWAKSVFVPFSFGSVHTLELQQYVLYVTTEQHVLLLAFTISHVESRMCQQKHNYIIYTLLSN